jgi:PAS domain S-box-containing protein
MSARRKKAAPAGHPLEAVFRQISTPIVISRLRDSVIVDVNDAWERVTGFRRADVLGRSAIETGHWTDLEARDRIARRVAAEGRAEDELVRFVRPDGTERKALVSCVKIDLGGEPHLLWSSRDVTEMQRAAERELQLNRKYAAVFATTPDAVAIARQRDGVHLEVNEAWERLTGRPREQAVGRSALEMGLWENTADRVGAVMRLESDGAVINYPTRFVRGDGRVIEVLLSGAKVVLDGEHCVVWSWNDVTEQRRAEEQARQSLEKFAMLFETVPVGIVVTRPRDHRIVEINDAALQIKGVTREEALGASSLEVVRWSDPAAFAPARARALAGERVVDLPVSFTRRDGRLVEVLLSSGTIELEGEPHLVISIRDVTEARRQQRALAESEERFQKAFESSQEAIGVTRLSDGRFVAVNPRMESLVKRPSREMLGRTTVELDLWADGDTVRERVVGALRRDGRIRDWVVRARRKSGEFRICNYSADVIEIGGEPHVIGFLRDVTEQRAAEQALADSEKRYRQLFDEALDGIALLSPAGEILHVNPAGCRGAGYACEELVGQTFERLVGAEAYSRMQAAMAAQLSKGPLRFELAIVRKDGAQLPVEVRAGLLPDGNIQVFLRDIRERKKSEELLTSIARGVSARVGKSFFRSVVEFLCRELPADMAFIGEVVSGSSERVRTIAFCRDGELAPDFEYRLPGSPCIHALDRRGSIVHPERVAELYPEDAGLARLGVQGYAGTSLYGSSGEPLGILVVLTRSAIRRPEFFVSMLEVFAARAAAEIERARAEHQVKELAVSLERRVQERTAELEAANRELESFSYSVSHDLRAPLRAIAGFAAILREDFGAELPAEALRLFQRIEANATRMGELIDDLLELSRAGRGALERNVVNMRSLVDAVLRDLQHERGGVAIEIGELPPATGDATLLRHVWQNLIGNALKFSAKADAPRVLIGATRSDGRVEFFVRDNGAGFDMRYAGKLFGLFQRLHAPAEFEGTGVGLAIVQRIVHRHGGEVRGEGEPGRGATFRFSLPAT